MIYQTNSKLKLAHDYVQFTDRNIFLTGKAGTGKTTFLHELKKSINKRMVVVAPTGVAAINAGGVTIHSFFQLPFGPAIPYHYFASSDGQEQAVRSDFKMSREKINIIRSLDLLVIDEISMVRADLLDGVDQVLRRYRNHNKAFGGVQLLMIGDIQQLAPIIKDNEWEILEKYYESSYFFSSIALKEAGFVGIELTHVFRQSDELFISLLNDIRNSNLANNTLEKLNKRFIADFNPDDKDGYIRLCTHNYQADNINELKLASLKIMSRFFDASVSGDFPEYSYPTKYKLELKVGSQVMFVKNDPSPEKNFFNGKIGEIISITDDSVEVKCPQDSNTIIVSALEWKNYKYTINPVNNEIEEDETGAFKQIPLKLAWAITIHKSQGLTFDKVIIDAQSAFSHGQVYVALSRCRTFEGLVLSSEINSRGIMENIRVNRFEENASRNQPNEIDFLNDRNLYQHKLLDELFSFRPLAKRLGYFMKLIRNNQSILLGDILVLTGQIKEKLEDSIMLVSDKFLVQVNHLKISEPDVDQNPVLQDRIGKAAEYFIKEINENILNKVDAISIETDNKKVKQELSDALNKVINEIDIKMACLEVSKKGLNISDFQKARALALMEKPKDKKLKKQGIVSIPKEIAHPILFEQLKKWRSKKSAIIGTEPYMILHQKALVALVVFLPVTESQLKSIKGIGKRTFEKYGQELINMISEYCAKNNVESNQSADVGMEEEPSKKKVSNKNKSFEMFKNGLSISEIAVAMGYVNSTIEGHLAHFVGTGELKIEQFISAEKIRLITEKVNLLGPSQLAPIKAELGEGYSYSDIRFVAKHIEFLESESGKTSQTKVVSEG